MVQAKDDTAVSFENVKFRYFNSDVYIFENLNLELKKNKHTILADKWIGKVLFRSFSRCVLF